MINIKDIENKINCFVLASIMPIGYFAPIGEWLLLALLCFFSILRFIYQPYKVNNYNLVIFILICLFLILSCYLSNYADRSFEVILPKLGIIFSIFFVLNITAKNKIKNIHSIIGLSFLSTSIIIFLDLSFNAGIRASLASIIGDAPSSDSATYSRGILVLTLLTPIVIANYINKKKYLLAAILMILASIIIIAGPNETAKVILGASLISTLIIYYFGPRAIIGFGIISIIGIVFMPLIFIYSVPLSSHINFTVEKIKPCTHSRVWQIKGIITDRSYKIIFNDELQNNKNIMDKLKYFQSLKKNDPVPENILKILYKENIMCLKKYKWQDTPVGGSIIHRLLVWEYVSNQVLEKPFLGYGIGTSRLIGQNIILNIPNSNSEIKGGIPLHPHNNFLQIWLELGLIGIILLTLLWLKALKFAYFVRNKSYIMGTGISISILNIFIVSNLSFGIFQAWWLSVIALTLLLLIQNNEYNKDLK